MAQPPLMDLSHPATSGAVVKCSESPAVSSWSNESVSMKMKLTVLSVLLDTTVNEVTEKRLD